MPTLPINLPDQARRGLARLGLDEAALALLGAGDDFVESEKAFREAGRLEAIGADPARQSAGRAREERFNAAGVRQLNRALAELQSGVRGLDREVRQQINQAVRNPEFQQRLAETREAVYENIAVADISAAEAQELVTLWNEAQAALEAEGFDGVIERARQMTERARDARNSRTRGREPHSPLATWKYFVLAGVLLISAATVIACFIWGACAWIITLAQALLGAGSWVVVMIQNGCPPIPLEALLKDEEVQMLSSA